MCVLVTSLSRVIFIVVCSADGNEIGRAKKKFVVVLAPTTTLGPRR